MEDGNDESFRVSCEKRTTTMRAGRRGMRIAGKGYKTGRFTYVGPAPPPGTDTDIGTSPDHRSLAQ
jgi:hypothetical protein